MAIVYNLRKSAEELRYWILSVQLFLFLLLLQHGWLLTSQGSQTPKMVRQTYKTVDLLIDQDLYTKISFYIKLSYKR